jgi:hypothetical protein
VLKLKSSKTVVNLYSFHLIRTLQKSQKPMIAIMKLINTWSCLSIALLLSLNTKIISAEEANYRFPDAHEKPLENWKGSVFQLSQDYPQKLEQEKDLVWEEIDFKNEPERYLRTVLKYAVEGNDKVDWAGQSNQVRKWYHAPWLHWDSNGREFVHGLTREKDSLPGELAKSQTNIYQNWAVGLYNAPGGYTVGQVWKNPEAPDSSKADFPVGTVSVKIFFTQASEKEVPYLKGAKIWEAFIHKQLQDSSTKQIETLRLIQVDLAIRDSRAEETGWVFGAFAYNGFLEGKTVWDRMVPVGLMWGNDPGVTEEMVKTKEAKIQETWLNPNLDFLPRIGGYAGRMNGPLDNPISSCLSCHSTAQQVPISSLLPPATLPLKLKMRWFRNLKYPEPFDKGQQSLNYSLQLSEGIRNFYASRAGAVQESMPSKQKVRMLEKAQ